jgi:hypothetical protein
MQRRLMQLCVKNVLKQGRGSAVEINAEACHLLSLADSRTDWKQVTGCNDRERQLDVYRGDSGGYDSGGHGRNER